MGIPKGYCVMARFDKEANKNNNESAGFTRT
jgi:hypothetical protein